MDFHCIHYVTKAAYILDSHHPTTRICFQIQKVIYLPSYQLPSLVYFSHSGLFSIIFHDDGMQSLLM